MQTVIETQKTQNTRKEYKFNRIPEKQETRKSGKGVARVLILWLIAIFIMTSVVTGLRAYSRSLEVMSLQSQSEMTRVNERIDELKGEINNIHTESLMNSSHENSQIADNPYFVRDLWEVGG